MIVVCGKLRVPRTREEVARDLRLSGEDDVEIVRSLMSLEELYEAGMLPQLVIGARDDEGNWCTCISAAPVVGSA